MKLHSLETDPEYISLQTELVKLQKHIQKENKRLLIIFEGRDTAGKGGSIMRFVRYLNPRRYRIVALNKPSEVEEGQWYFQRYIKQLPDPGEIAFFDRSWYNRAVVEPVMGFCTKEEYEQFMINVNIIEKMLVDDGIKIIKFWFSIDIEEQKNRLERRRTNPLQQWKLSTVDAVAQQKWEDYTEYKIKMFERTSTLHSPWVVIKGNNKDIARLEAIRYVVNHNDYAEKGLTSVRLTEDPEVVTILNSSMDIKK
ncbi:MAG: polyphosphate kinase 2 [Chloroflexia bacterium]|nr:polyphosphate kinase 2 [Chloroflexia bacterium]